MKCCIECGAHKPHDLFYRRRDAVDGYRARCKLCHERRRAVLLAEPNRRARAQIQHRVASRAYAERHRAAHKTDPDYRIYRRRANRLRYARHRDQILTQMRVAYANSPEKKRQASRNWQKRNPDHRKIHKATRRALKTQNGGRFTVNEWNDLLVLYRGRCLKCGTAEDVCPDHVVPLSKGGGNSIHNIQPLCRRCNSVKGTATTDYRPAPVQQWELPKPRRREDDDDGDRDYSERDDDDF